MSLYTKNYQKHNKLSRAFFYKNIHETPTKIENLTLFYTLEKNISLNDFHDSISLVVRSYATPPPHGVTAFATDRSFC